MRLIGCVAALIATGILTSLTLVSCSPKTSATRAAPLAAPSVESQKAKQLASETAIVKQNLQRDLYDDTSARYRNVYRIVTMDLPTSLANSMLAPGGYCGEINAKNQFGAYVGFRRFFSFPMPLKPEQHADIEDPTTGMEPLGWTVFCKEKTGTPVQF